MFCANCGYELNSKVKYCSKCGTKLDEHWEVTNNKNVERNTLKKETKDGLVKYTCEQCGAPLVRIDKFTFGCEYCGSKYYIENEKFFLKVDETYPLIIKASKYKAEKKYNNEIECYLEALKLDNTSELIWCKLGVAYRRVQMVDKSLECFENAIYLNPEYGQAVGNIGAIYLARGMFFEAIKYYKKAIDCGIVLEKDGDFSDHGVILANMALAYGFAGKMNEYSDYFRKAEALGYDGIKKIELLVKHRERILDKHTLPLQLDSKLIENILVESNIPYDADKNYQTGARFSLSRRKTSHACETIDKNYQSVVSKIIDSVAKGGILETTKNSLLFIATYNYQNSLIHIEEAGNKTIINTYIKDTLIKKNLAQKVADKYVAILETLGQNS